MPSSVFSPSDLSQVIAIARDAGALALRYFNAWHGGDASGALAVEMKEGDEPVTAADRAVSDLCVGRLRAAFPADAILSEERPDDGTRHHAARTWLVDPIDGTKDFIAGKPWFAVMIGLLEGGRPTLGVVYQPTTGRLWYGQSGGGAFAVEGQESPQPLLVSTVSDLTAARMVSAMGSVGIKLGMLATAERDLYVNPAAKCKLWDTAAPEVILTEAGGRLSDLRGAPLTYTGVELGHHRGMVASNSLLHAAALEQLAPLVARLLPLKP